MIDSMVEQIVGVLIGAANPVPARVIAKRIGVSESSVRHKMPLVRKFVAGQGVKLNSAPGKGFWLEAAETARDVLEGHLSRELDPMSSFNYRRDCILGILFMSKSAYTMQAIAEDLGVSRSTVASDLDDIEKWLAPFEIELVRTRNVGVYVVGDEVRIRDAIMESRHQLALEAPANLERPDDLDYRVSGTFYNYFRVFYGTDEKLRLVQEAVLDAEHELGYRFADAPFVHVFEYIALASDRVRQGNVASAPGGGEAEGTAAPSLGEATARELSAAAGVSARIFRDRAVPSREVSYLASLLALYGERDVTPPEDSVFGAELVGAYARMLFLALEGQLGPDSAAEQADVESKLLSLIDRKSLRENYAAITNKYLVRDVKRAAPRLFGLALVASRLLGARQGCPPLGLPLAEADLSYVAMLLDNALERAGTQVRTLLITSFDDDLSTYFKHKIERNVPTVRVERVIDIGEAELADFGRYDLVVTTVLMDAPEPVKVSRRLDRDDLSMLEGKARDVLRQRDRVRRHGRSLFERPFVLLDCRARRKEDAIAQGCALLEREGAVDGDFFEQVLRGEEVAASAACSGAAIPCGVGTGVKRSAVAVVRLRRPVYWGGGEHVDVMFLLAVTTRRGRRVRTIPAEFYALLGTDALERIRAAHDVRAVEAALAGERVFLD